jgi:hypothetical protein
VTAALKFDEGRHEYTLDGRPVPNVTRIIDWMNSYAHVPTEIMNRARDIGTAVHLATALDDTDDLDVASIDPAVQPYLDAWRQFRADMSFKPMLVEKRVYSPTYGYAGTLDRAGLLQDMPALLDIKATAALMPANGPQTAAYKQALMEQGYPGAAGMARYTVRLCPDLTPPYRVDRYRSTDDLAVFICSLNIYNWRKKNGYKNSNA